MIGYYRYEGYPLEQKIGWIRDGAGPSALSGAQDALVGLTTALADSEERLRRLVEELGGSWKGAAAENAGKSVRRALTWSGDSGQVTGDAKTSVDLQAEQVALTRNLTPGCAPGSPEYGLDDALADGFNAVTGGLFDVQTNFDEQAAKRRALEEQVDRVLYAHEAASRTNLAAVPALAEVPKVTTRSEPPATDCLPVVPVRTTDEPPPSIGEREEEVRKDEKTSERSAEDRKTSRKEGEDDGKPGQVEPERERTTTAAHATSPPETRQQPVAEPQQQNQNNTRPSTVHTGLPAVGRAEAGRPGAGSPFSPGPLTTSGSGGRVGAGRSAGTGSSSGRAGGTGVVASAGRGPEQPRTPGGGTAVRSAPAPGSSSARPGAPGQPRGGLTGAGYGPQGVAQREEDAEHSDRYYARNDDIFGLADLGAAPTVLGEEPG
ncbi:PPE family protein [Lentzea fradiae]|uniref:PPE family protein n=1 Tax=Lentzea fradiae TaxID=200378 RepID=A0A1G7YCQ7_9PSEU|nr:PPE family protein [Lentzea fradiae]